MINGNLDVFLDTGWYSEATLYYNGYVYWLEGYVNQDKKSETFFVNKWKAELSEDYLYHEYIDADGNPIGFCEVFKKADISHDKLKKAFLEAEIFDGKTFWNIQDEIVWTEPGHQIVKN